MTSTTVQTAEGVRPSGELPFVSVIVPVYDDAASIARLLGALAAQDYPRGRFECLIVDNASPALLEIAPASGLDVRLLREPQPGSYAARNRGVLDARGDVLAFTDADCVPRPDWLSAAVARLRVAEGPVMVGGGVEVVPRGAAPASAVEWHSVLNDFDQARYVTVYGFAASANLVTTRAAFDRVGAFDATLLSGGDYEWGRRAAAAGVAQVHAEEAGVLHPARTTWSATAGRYRRLIGGHVMLQRRGGRSPAGSVRLVARIACAAWRRILRDPRLPGTGVRLRVLAVDVAVRAVQLHEIVRLAAGAAPRRR